MDRRNFIRAAGTAMGMGMLAGGSRAWGETTPPPASLGDYPFVPAPPLAPVRARPDRIVKITVGLRPFRNTGPNLSVEKVGAKTIVHNYGHGGSGWSLSWGTGSVAVAKALQTGEDHYAVLGCGAIGLTTATLLQRAGKHVTIYTKERPPSVTSSLATGVWSPDSRICLEEAGTDAFAQEWEGWCRTSYRQYQNLLGLTGEPVQWFDRYGVYELPPEEMRKRREAEAGGPKFAHFEDRVRDLTPVPDPLPEGAHPFRGMPYVTRTSQMVFNLTAMSKFLLDGFLAEGGRIEVREFHAPEDLTRLPENTLINAMGLGAATLFKDSTVTPVRGQLTVLIPQAEVNYGLSCDGASLVPRRDGLIVQSGQPTDFGNTDTTPDHTESEKALRALAAVTRTMLPAV